ncbi:tex261 protein [Anaeramoeba flamelloides]|uniref:Tex261 protein n=1 Tax=Anaeramoeba flamelloides TaxID=1746091 RepID=A0AAV8A858_9EUKA|nr:tex261 protein [Anaeramoeba flamelloides]KAJ6253881.1 tex261 protein [Anaeramoeba flamelloides]
MLVYALLLFISYSIILGLLSISLASSLFYFAKMSDENPSRVIKFLRGLVCFVVGFLVLFLFFEPISNLSVILSITTHLMYYFLINDFPLVNVKTLKFIFTCIIAFVSNVVAIKSAFSIEYNLWQILGYLFFTEWLCPFVIFIALLADENIIPTTFLNSLPYKKSKK